MTDLKQELKQDLKQDTKQDTKQETNTELTNYDLYSWRSHGLDRILNHHRMIMNELIKGFGFYGQFFRIRHLE